MTTLEEPGISPPRWATSASEQSLDALLCLTANKPYNMSDIQDFDIQLCDASRLIEFCDLYETKTLDRDGQFLLGKLIVASADEWMAEAAGPDDVDTNTMDRVERLLRGDFLLHFQTIDYWRCPQDQPLEQGEGAAYDGEEDIDGFNVTPMIRRVWDACFRPEYAVWRGTPSTEVLALLPRRRARKADHQVQS